MKFYEFVSFTSLRLKLRSNKKVDISCIEVLINIRQKRCKELVEAYDYHAVALE